MIKVNLILHKKSFTYIYTDMNNSFFNMPLYPPNETPNQNQTNQQNQNNSGFSLQNILPLLMGMNKNGTMDLSSILSNNMPKSPLFDMLSSMQNNKKESQSSPKKIPDEEYF